MNGDAEVKLLSDDLWLFSGYFWQILANPSYFLATVWLILATLGKCCLFSPTLGQNLDRAEPIQVASSPPKWVSGTLVLKSCRRALASLGRG